MSTLELGAAVEAAAKSFFDCGQAQRRDDGRKREDGRPFQWDEDVTAIDQHGFREFVLPIVDAAAVAIEAQVREMVAAEIEAACYPHTFQSIADVECPACTKAARIARGVTA